MKKTKEINKKELQDNIQNKDKGITIISLIITIALMLIIVSTTIYVSLDRFEINRYNKMKNDLELLSDKVANYYLKYNSIPVVKDETNSPILYPTPEFDKNVNDNENYYILDLEAIGDIQLNYGEEGFKDYNNSDDIYIINQASHTIYYVKGRNLKGITYHSIDNIGNSISDTIPPSKPEIKVISGTMNSEGKYTSDVEIEIIPGKDSWSGVDKTTYIINDGDETDLPNNNILKITESGTYTIKARTSDESGNTSEYTTIQLIVSILKIGEYVEYDLEYEDMYYTGKIYGKNDGWRYLGKDDNGNYLIVSTGIPGILYYAHLPGATLPDWWATDTEVQLDTGIYNTDAGWNYSSEGYPNKYAAYGLRYKFESIPFTYQESETSVSTKNTGVFRKVGDTTSGTNVNLNFRVSGVNIVDVHNLTLAELNRVTNKATTPEGTRLDTDTAAGFKALTGTANGLFDMQDLVDYTANYVYWLASPCASNRWHLYRIDYGHNYVNSSIDKVGIRPVVTLSSAVQFVDINKDGVWEISQ